MDHPEGASETGGARLSFDRRVRLEFHGSKISSDGGLLLFRELDEVLGLHDIADGILRDTHSGRHTSPALTTSSRMRVSASKSEEKRLDGAVQTSANQTESRTDSTAGTRNHAQLARRMPSQRHGVLKRIDRGPKQRQYAGERILLGECRIILSRISQVT